MSASLSDQQPVLRALTLAGTWVITEKASFLLESATSLPRQSNPEQIAQLCGLRERTHPSPPYHLPGFGFFFCLLWTKISARQAIGQWGNRNLTSTLLCFCLLVSIWAEICDRKTRVQIPVLPFSTGMLFHILHPSEITIMITK